MSVAWKNAERQAAKALGGTRNQRGADFSKSMPDVEHPLFSVECKYRKTLPRLLRLGLDQAASYDHSKPPLLVVKERYQRGALVVMKLADFVDLVGPLTSQEKDVAYPPSSATESGSRSSMVTPILTCGKMGEQ